jgi:cellulose synthase/poly-beta-1,6-N-acetylglucosamine synthase-like glycosyltransferase
MTSVTIRDQGRTSLNGCKGNARTILDAVIVLVILFWASAAALAWTHLAYPAAMAALARIASRPALTEDVVPTVAVIVAAYNEEAVIARRIENLLALDYPAESLQIVVSSDASTDQTEEIASQFPGVRVISNPRGGKVAAQDRAVRETESEIVAFSDANCTWASDALRRLVRAFADPEVAYVCGQLRILDAAGDNKEGVYWRYEMAVRHAESQLSSVTGGNGSIYAVRRSDYVEVDPRFGHDLSLPYLMVQRGRRAVYEPSAHASEKPTPTNETEYRRKVRMFEHCWLIMLKGRVMQRLGLFYGLEIVSHRLLRYGSGLLHVVLLATSIVLVTHGWPYVAILAFQLLLIVASLAGVGIARYYTLVSWATLVALWNFLRRGVPATWEVAEGTR